MASEIGQSEEAKHFPQHSAGVDICISKNKNMILIKIEPV
jgi:hypothetical protein